MPDTCAPVVLHVPRHGGLPRMTTVDYAWGSGGKGSRAGSGGASPGDGRESSAASMLKERWVTFNKDRFYEIFNETLLHEMTEQNEEDQNTAPLNLVVGEQENRIHQSKVHTLSDIKPTDNCETSKVEEKVIKQFSESPPDDGGVTACVGSADSRKPGDELVKTRPLVCAALFGAQSSGKGSKEAEIILASSYSNKRTVTAMEQQVQNPVSSPSSISSSSQHSTTITTKPSSTAPHITHSVADAEDGASSLTPQSAQPPPAASWASSGAVTTTNAADQLENYEHLTVSATTGDKKTSEIGLLSEEESATKTDKMRRASVSVQQQQNWVSLNKSTLYNLVDQLVGSRLGSSGEEEDEEESNTNKDKTSNRTLYGRNEQVINTVPTINNNIDSNKTRKQDTRSDNTKHKNLSVMLKDKLSNRQRNNSTDESNGGKQVLKQCWVALNKNVVYDMVDLAMAQDNKVSEGNDDNNKLQACDGHCSENSSDSGCSVHGAVGTLKSDDKKEDSCYEVNSKTSGKKREFANNGNEKDSKRKCIRNSPVSSGRVPQRPASAPVASTKGLMDGDLKRAPSPHSKEYAALRHVHGVQCEEMLTKARQARYEQMSRNNREAGPQIIDNVTHTQQHKPLQPSKSSLHQSSVTPLLSSQSAAKMESTGRRESPKLGWVAVSKAEVHTIVDSVMSSLLQQESVDSTDSASLPPLVEPHPATTTTPHRPWLVEGPCPSSPDKLDPPHSASPSPSSSSSSSATLSPVAAEPTIKASSLKWKSNLLLRCQESEEETTKSTSTGTSSSTTSVATSSTTSLSSLRSNTSKTKTRRTRRQKNK